MSPKVSALRGIKSVSGCVVANAFDSICSKPTSRDDETTVE
jgi:hypothetical protein